MPTEAQRRAQAILDEFVARGAERGLQVAAYWEGALVVDAWAGIADTATDRPVDGETLFTVFSATKGIVATAVHVLADRGQLEYDRQVAHYWPEFGSHGKECITLRHILAHQAGIPHLPDGTTAEDMCDWQRMCRAIADLTPVWKPGSRTGYSSYTWGWVVGEVVRRADGRSIAQVVQDELCRPLGIDSLYLGVPNSAETRVAPLEDGGWAAGYQSRPPDGLVRRVLPPELTTPAVFNRSDVRRAAIPAMGGIVSARALARLYANLAGGDPYGKKLLTPERVRRATSLQTDETDMVLGTAIRKALGYFLGGPGSPMGDRISAFGHAGIGGAIGFADPAHHFALALLKNRLTGPSSGQSITLRAAQEIRAALGIPEAG